MYMSVMMVNIHASSVQHAAERTSNLRPVILVELLLAEVLPAQPMLCDQAQVCAMRAHDDAKALIVRAAISLLCVTVWQDALIDAVEGIRWWARATPVIHRVQRLGVVKTSFVCYL